MAHCNCMAGLCKACSHVGALLFAVEVGVRMRDSFTCTQEKSKWIMPSYVRDIPYIPVSEMDLFSAKKRYTTLGEQSCATAEVNRANVQALSTEEIASFLENVSKCGIKPAILSLVPPYNASFVFTETKSLPQPLTDLYNEQYLNIGFQELLQQAERVFDELMISAYYWE